MYLGSPIDFGFESNEDVETIERFFLWLGVNKHIKLSPLKFIKGKHEHNEYLNFVFENYVQRPQLITLYHFDGVEIVDFNETFKNVSPEKVILLLISDGRLKQKIEQSHGDSLLYQYGQAYNAIICPSYVQFQLQTLYNFSEFLLDDNQIPFLNKFQLNLEDGILQTHNIKTQECNYIISRLGAKLSFSELKIESVYEYIRNCKENDSKHEYGRKLYLAAFNYFKSIEDADFAKFEKDYYLLAEKGGAKDYRAVSEVYYSDNNTMPSQIISKYWIFDFPKRNGEDQIARYFGVKKIDSIAVSISEESILRNRHVSSKDFNFWFEKIKPFIFAHRLSTIKTDTLKKANLSSIKNVEIVLVSSVNYSFEGYPNNILLPGEYLKVGANKFVLCGEAGQSIESLKESSEFSEAFSEIICSVFLVSDKKDDYRAIFKDKKSLKDSLYLIKSKSLEDKLEESKALFGVSFQELDFWNACLELKGKKLTPDITQQTDLVQELKVNLGDNIELPDYYNKIDFENFNNKESYEFLKWICEFIEIDLLVLKQKMTEFIGLREWHFFRCKNLTYKIEEVFGKALLVSLLKKEAIEHKKFIEIRKTYNEFMDQASRNISSKEAYVFDVDYEKSLIDELNLKYDIDTTEVQLKDVSIVNFYEKELKDNNIEISDLSEEVQGLLYFEGYGDYLKEIFANLKKEENISTEDTPSDSVVLPIAKTLIYGKNAPIPTGKKAKIRPPLQFSKKREAQQKKAGKIAEKLVFNSLKKEYPEGNIQWVSGNSEQQGIIKDDSLGYDIRYTIDNSENWIFLEVKSVSNDSFIISAHEVYVAFEKGKLREKYHLGLVKDGRIHMIEDVFSTEEWKDNFELIQGVSSIRPLDFEVFFELP
jgi:hypothetical protein